MIEISPIAIKQGTLTLIFSVLLAQTHCEPPRREICEALAREIDHSYTADINKKTRMDMLMRYDELDCGPLK